MDRSRVSGMACLLITCLFFTLVLFQSGPPADLPNSKTEREAALNERPPVSAASTRRYNASSVAPLISDVVDVSALLLELTLDYGQGTVAASAELTPMQAQAAPQVKLVGANEGLFTLLMVDPDAPSPDAPTEAQWLHWLINIPGSSIAEGDEVVLYNGPTPPVGRHRYVFLIYKQPSTLATEPPASRNRFNAKMFANLNGLGDPIGAHLFYASAVGSRSGLQEDAEVVEVAQTVEQDVRG